MAQPHARIDLLERPLAWRSAKEALPAKAR